MLQLDTALIKTASRCNYDCTYCYVYQSKDTSWRVQPKRMSLSVIEALCSRLIHQAQMQKAGFAIVLHGGEPLLIGYDRLHRLISGLRSALDPIRYPISVQTNGALLDRNLLDLFADNRVSVSISIDGPQYINDIGRVDRKGKGTFFKTLKGLKVLSTHPDSKFLFAGTLSVVQPTSLAKEVYAFLKDCFWPVPLECEAFMFILLPINDCAFKKHRKLEQ